MTINDKAIEAAALIYAKEIDCGVAIAQEQGGNGPIVALCGEDECSCIKLARKMFAALPPDTRIAELEAICAASADALRSAEQSLINRNTEIAEMEAKLINADRAAIDAPFLTRNLQVAMEQITALQSQVETMRAALEPFGEIAEAYRTADEAAERRWRDEGRAYSPRTAAHRVSVSIGDCRRAHEARAALGPDPKGGKP